MLSQGGRGAPSKATRKSGGSLAREIGSSWVLSELKDTKLSSPHCCIKVRSEEMESDMAWCEVSLFLVDGARKYEEEACRVASSAYECMGFSVVERRSSINIRKRVGDRTAPCGTPRSVKKIPDDAPSTTAEKDRSER
jgi:hypothetical protein